RGVAIVAINPNESQSAAAIAEHAQEFKLAFEIVPDQNGELARSLGLTICPEAYVLDSQGKVRYRGRIDERYARRGGAAEDPRSHELRDAVDAVLACK